MPLGSNKDSASDDDFSKGDLEDSAFEESLGGADPDSRRKEVSLVNDKYDLALEVSASAQSDDLPKKEQILKNDRFDEALDVSASQDFGESKDEEERLTPKHMGGTRSALDEMKNDKFDAAYDLSSADETSVDTAHEAERTRARQDPLQAKAQARLEADSASSSGEKEAVPARTSLNDGSPSGRLGGQATGGMRGPRSDESESEASSDEGVPTPMKLEGGYNPEDYAHLNVTAEIKDLFQYVQRYKPHEVELETQLKCFVPDYIPSVGDIDAFLKVDRPDEKPDYLGLRVLDEPAANQSDGTVLELQLRANSKKQYGDIAVRSIENAAKNPHEVEKWIKSIHDLHRSKPPPQVNYKKTMPDIDSLMEVWPPEMEDMLQRVEWPSPELEMSLEDYARVLLALLDIPVHDNIIESLHLLFSTYMAFKENAHFQNIGAQEQDPSPGHYK
ncbi:unnamed protein product [Chrysoparadoxa australica]